MKLVLFFSIIVLFSACEKPKYRLVDVRDQQIVSATTYHSNGQIHTHEVRRKDKVIFRKKYDEIGNEVCWPVVYK